jgi:beta-galactosidase/beta-glucuronidase
VRLQGLGTDDGCIELSRNFNWVARLEPTDNVWLVFDKVAGSATVRLNGKTLGQHNVFWDRFRFPVTDLLQPRNELVVTLDPSGAGAKHPAVRGILGGVHLSVESRRFALQKLSLETHWQSSSGILQFTADWNSSTQKPFTAVLRLDDREILRQQATDRCTFAVDGLEIEPWWPRQLGFPKLYPLCLEFLDGDEVLYSKTWQVGFRSFRRDGGTLFCNDRLAIRDLDTEFHSLKMTDAFQEYFGEERTKPFNQWKLAQQPLLKVADYVAPNSLYSLCDRGGLIVNQDLNFMHDDPSPSGAEDVRQNLARHPSVICSPRP